MANNCVFCDIAKGKIPAKRIYENSNFFSILDQNQKIKGHALVISKKHFVNSLDFPASLGSDLMDCIKNTSLKLIEENKAEGFNLINNNFEPAGQLVMHFHCHILPRKKDDDVKIFE